jgi:ribosomal protein S18 acetylase RimI-like enzyme
MSSPTKRGEPVSIHTECTINGTKYLASNHDELVSLGFVLSAYTSEAMYWAAPLDADTVRLMVQKSSVLGLYRRRISSEPDQQPPPSSLADAGPSELEQVGMARFITDHVTHAYLTDIYVAPALRGNGLGTWLVKCCNDFIGQMPALRKAMLATSNPKRNAAFYQAQLGMSVPPQDPEKHLVLLRKGDPAARSSTQ